jgi:hypothetical protein
MNWFKDKNGHILESKNRIHRLLYCPLCQKLIFKVECQKLRQDKNGALYPSNVIIMIDYQKYNALNARKKEK